MTGANRARVETESARGESKNDIWWIIRDAKDEVRKELMPLHATAAAAHTALVALIASVCR